MKQLSTRDERLRRYWDKHAGSYDQQMAFLERRVFGDTRRWLCSQASGAVLEVAVGTGRNLPYYPSGVRLTGIELSPKMLDIARHRAADLSLPAELSVGDAHVLPFGDSSFDTVVCTFSLCGITDERRAIHEMDRVLRPGGLLLLADHVVASPWYGRLVQRLVELLTVPVGGEHFRRRPLLHVQALGYHLERHDRFALGIIERFAARKRAISDQCPQP